MRKNTRLFCLLAALAVLFASCGANQPPETSEPPINISQTPVGAGSILRLSADAARNQGTPIDGRMGGAVSDFTLRLLQSELEKNQNKNIVLSPLSAMYALAMTANGASGETLAQMEQVLGGGLTVAELNGYFASLGQALTADGTLSMADSIWAKDTLTVKDTFLQDNAVFYGADVFKAPFDQATLDAINAWAREQTDGRIDSLLDAIDPMVELYLIHAISFTGEWEKAFYGSSTGSFTAADGREQQADMLYSPSEVHLLDENASGFLKHYKGEFAFAAFLPDEGISAEAYAASLAGTHLYQLDARTCDCTVAVRIPSFSCDAEIDLIPSLQEMGMTDAFGAHADFSNLAEEDLQISMVKQNAQIAVGLEGTEAAAATVVEVERKGMADLEEISPKELVFDRPFVYALIHVPTGIPVFVGVQNSVEG